MKKKQEILVQMIVICLFTVLACTTSLGASYSKKSIIDSRTKDFSSFKDMKLGKDEKLDIVYMWVNGSDPDFIREIQKYRPSSEESNPQRFQDNYELFFSLRSLHKYVPFVNNIYIVTNGQVPFWLNTSAPNIKVVPHKDIFTDPTVLPVFNSQAIEGNIHNIANLTDYYILLNDDMFFRGKNGTPLGYHDFFTPEGKMKVYFEVYPIPNWLYYRTHEKFLKYTIDVVNGVVPNPRREVPYTLHTPRIYNKHWTNFFLSLSPEEHAKVSARRFRKKDNIDVILYLSLIMDRFSEAYIPISETNYMDYDEVALRNSVDYETDLFKMRKTVDEWPTNGFTIQDYVDYDKPLDTIIRGRKVMRMFMKLEFSEPSPWENKDFTFSAEFWEGQ
ncbi:hypothetical protein PCE1_000495 [Barthelona sp. PCE]